MFDQLIQIGQTATSNLFFIFDRFMGSTHTIIESQLPKAISDTIYMTVISTFFAILIGLPIGLVLYSTARGGLFPNRFANRLLSVVVDSIRAIPFIILAFALIPVNSALVGSGIGINATIVALIIMATPFFARVAEMAFRSVDTGLIEALRAMGASRRQIITNVLIPESLSSLATGATVTIISIISATSLAGYLGGGGLGDLAIRYGYQRYLVEIMLIVILVLIIFNMLVQWLGDRMAQKLDHHNR